MDSLTADRWPLETWVRWNKAVQQYGEARTADPAAKGWMSMIDLPTVANYPAEYPGRAEYTDGYVVLNTVGRPWYAKEGLLLYEQLVLRVDPGVGSYRSVLAFLHDKAKRCGCRGIVVGDAFMLDDRLKKLYMRAGFRPEATELFKEL